MAKTKTGKGFKTIATVPNLLIAAGILFGVHSLYKSYLSQVYCASCVVVPALLIGAGIFLKNRKSK